MRPRAAALIAAACLTACSGAGTKGERCARECGERQLTDTEREVQESIERIPIEAVKTLPATRERLRAAGRPVMTVEGRPGYLYWDLIGPEQLRNPAFRVPQDRPDVQGCVVVSFEIRPDGRTDKFEIVESDPPGVFDKAALRAAYATEYEPAPPAARHQRALWFLVARPPRSDISRVNEVVEIERNKRREAQRAACEGKVT